MTSTPDDFRTDLLHGLRYVGGGAALYFGGPAVFRYFRDNGLGVIWGLLGTAAVALVAGGILVMLFFLMGWALRKGWRAADQD